MRAPCWSLLTLGFAASTVLAAPASVEIAADGLVTVELGAVDAAPLSVGASSDLFPAVPDWSNTLRRQIGGLRVADLDGDGWDDVVAAVYHSNSFPSYDDWHNLIYFNTGGELEASPSWVSVDEVSSGDVQIAWINGDVYPDVVVGNGGFAMDPSVIYFGSASGPSMSPGWFERTTTWTNYVLPFDVDHDGDVDLVTANQGNSQNDPYRPLQLFLNQDGSLDTMPSWQSAESSIQNFLAFGDLDGDGWEDLAVSKWSGFESGVYANSAGSLETTPVWTTGDTDTDKGIGWADVDGNGDEDLALGHDPTQLWTNVDGTLSATWTSSAGFFGQQDLRWFDVDSDGDPDLAEIHFSNGVINVYVNQEGVLDSVPTWSYDGAGVGNAIAFGDINRDGAPDLVAGYAGDDSLLVFYGFGSPTVFADGFESGDLSAWSSSTP